MTEQSGRNEPSDRQGSDRPASDGASSGRPASGQSGADKSRPAVPGADMLSDLQRWLIRSSARTMRKELTGQVRRTFSGGQRTSTANVWDTATNEIPPDAGESPECQWCPICRAARRMRDSGPGIGGQLSGAGDAVASAVQDAVSALDSILGKASGSRASEPRTGGPRAGAPRAGAPRADAPRAGGPSAGGAWAGESRGASGARASRPAAESATTSDAGAGTEQRPGFDEDDPAGQQGAPYEHHDDAPPHGSAAGDHGPGGWKPGDRLATAQSAEPDSWAAATEPDDGTAAGGEPGADSAGPSVAENDGQLDGQGHEPDDRG
jgi:hypothetical protein